MNKYLILITVLIILYLYWKAQQKSIAPKSEEIIERKGKEVFFEAEDFDLNSDNENSTIHEPRVTKWPVDKKKKDYHD